MPKTVGVAVSNATFHFDKLYTYAVMPAQQDAVRLGSMVLVPFGRGSRARMGVVLACDAEPESSKLKYLFDVAPASACLTPELLKLVYFLKERTFCTYYEAVKAVIPYGAQYKPAVAADGVTPVLQNSSPATRRILTSWPGSCPQSRNRPPNSWRQWCCSVEAPARRENWKKKASAGRCWTISAPKACWPVRGSTVPSTFTPASRFKMSLSF